ncbi:MAG TPA: two-component regulator propeller domain-containing protein, partial [Verrucomicrobiae bacterium]
MGSESQDLSRRTREFARGLTRVPAAKTGGVLQALGLIFLALWVPPASAAPPAELADSGYLLHTWHTEDGLPENSATAIVQTQDGYLWFGTFNGLVRFNGVTFKVFQPANTPHLPSAGIVNLHADKRDRLWVSTYAGLVITDGAQWRALGTNEGWAGNYVRAFVERANGDLLITTFDGHVMTAANDRLTELPLPPGE